MSLGLNELKLAQVMGCWMMTIMWTSVDSSSVGVLWHSYKIDFTESASEIILWNKFEKYTCRITLWEADEFKDIYQFQLLTLHCCGGGGGALKWSMSGRYAE